MSTPPSGEQYEISHAEQRATIVEVGGGVREYVDGDRDVLEPYPVEAVCDGAHGSPLIPWPNRLADGRYPFDGVEHQVALTEPEKQNAIHGFLRWRPWRAVVRDADRVVMGTRIYPMKGYPFTVEVSVAYELTDDGLVVTTAATNIGDRAAPFASGHHPYLSPGSGLIDDCTLELDAATRIDTDARQLPTGDEAVEGTDFDFRTGRRLGDQALDFAFKDLGRDGDGRAWVRLSGTDGRTAGLWADEHYPILEIYTGDTLGEGRRRTGLGAEPMTCPPNGLATGDRVVRLEPGENLTTRWGARLG